MSYCFDVQMKAWRKLQKTRSVTLSHLFENLMEDIHSANHRLDDKINADREVSFTARRLEKLLGIMEEESQ